MFMDNTNYTAIENITPTQLKTYCKENKLNFNLNKKLW